MQVPSLGLTKEPYYMLADANFKFIAAIEIIIEKNLPKQICNSNFSFYI